MKKNNRILAIDPGTHYIGLAVLDGTKLVYYGVKTLSWQKSPHDILTEGRKVIRDLIDDFDPATLVVEKTFFANNRNSALLNVFAGEIAVIGRRRKLLVQSIAANTVRKIICRDGKATKEDVAREMTRRYPELLPYLSSDKRWKERFHFNMFDAVALGIASNDVLVRSRDKSALQ